MSQKQKPDLAAALADASGSTRRRNIAEIPITAPEREETAGQRNAAYNPPSRLGTVPVTGHFPKQVRDQLKILAIEQGVTLHHLMAEAYNDLFAKYGKPEIAPGPGPG
jgi:hypothetical protein